jgi:sacsin
MNSAIFEDSEQKRKRKELQAQRIDQLLKTKWIPVYVKPPHPFLPWPEDCVSVAAPVETSIKENMWMVSYGRRLVDGDVHSVHLKKLLGWLDDVSVKDVSLQLSILGLTFDRLRCEIEAEISNNDQSMKDGMKTPSKFNNLCQKISSEVGRIYHLLNGVDSEYEVDVMKSVLHGCRWLWMGDDFVSSDHVAFTSAINAVPYLFTVPPDLACFRNLLSIFNVRETFGSSDYCLVLNRMAHGSNESSQRWNSKQIELAVSLTQKISDDVLKLGALEIYAPTQDHKMVLASSMVYDDAPWLSKDLPGKKNLIYAHPKLSSSVSEKIGIKSVRKLLLQSNADMISFGENVVHEAFGQSESLTRRLKVSSSFYFESRASFSADYKNLKCIEYCRNVPGRIATTE